MSQKSKLFSFGLASQDIADWLIEKYNFPEDTILTRLERPINQDGWVVNLYSSQFPEHGALDVLPTGRLKPGYKYLPGNPLGFASISYKGETLGHV